MNTRAFSVIRNIGKQLCDEERDECDFVVYFNENERFHFYFSEKSKCVVFAWFTKQECKEKLFDFLKDKKITKIEMNKKMIKNIVIYDRQKYWHYFLKLLIEKSELYARICGRPERLLRFGYFEVT